jgi:predicted nucleic acid-binding protein
VPEPIVINTGPLVTLARIGYLDLLGQLPFRWLCPLQVRQELDEGERAGHVRIAPPWLEVERTKSPLSPLSVASLDSGEAAVIQLALELAIDTVAIDEWKGRRAALAVGLQVTGSLGLLGRAKQLGVLPELTPLLVRARQEGIFYHPDLVHAVLVAVGEATNPA